MLKRYEAKQEKSEVDGEIFSRESIFITTQILKILLKTMHSCKKFRQEHKKKYEFIKYCLQILSTVYQWNISNFAKHLQLLFDSLVNKLLSCCLLLHKIFSDILQNLASRTCHFATKIPVIKASVPQDFFKKKYLVLGLILKLTKYTVHIHTLSE